MAKTRRKTQLSRTQQPKVPAHPKKSKLITVLLAAEILVAIVVSVLLFFTALGNYIGVIVLTSSYNPVTLVGLLQGILTFAGILFAFFSLIGIELIKTASAFKRKYMYASIVIVIVGTLLLVLVVLTLLLASLAVLGNTLTSGSLTSIAFAIKSSVFLLYFASAVMVNLQIIYAILRYLYK